MFYFACYIDKAEKLKFDFQTNLQKKFSYLQYFVEKSGATKKRKSNPKCSKSKMLIEKEPEDDEILSKFNTLKIE